MITASDEQTPMLQGGEAAKAASAPGGGNTFGAAAAGQQQQQQQLKSDEYRERQLQRKLMIKAEQEKIQNMLSFSPTQCAVAILLYVVVSVCFFSYWLEDWTMVDSVYFAVVTFTTIGYGDLVPDTRIARLFTCFWAISGVACLGIALGILGSKIVDVAEEDQKEALRKQHDEIFDLFKIPTTTTTITTTKSGSGGGDDGGGKNKNEDTGDLEANNNNNGRSNPVEEATFQCCEIINSPKSLRLAILIAIMAVMLYFISTVEGWSFSLTFYYGLITASTVGYGDFSPDTQMGRIIAICYIPVAVAVLGSFLDFVASSIIDSRKNSVLKQQVWDKELTLKDLKVMDADGDGNVTQLEFLEFMLVSMNQVEQGLLDELRSHFEKLDKDGNGALNKEDLVNIAEFNLSCRSG